MARIVTTPDDYLNTWMGQYMHFRSYMYYEGKGNSKGVQESLQIIRKHVDKPDEYQVNSGKRFKPDFTPSQKHRLNYLAEMYNHLASAEKPDVDTMMRVAEIPNRVVKEWATQASNL
jgi:hypothetical protein